MSGTTDVVVAGGVEPAQANKFQWAVAWIGAQQQPQRFPENTRHGTEGPSGASDLRWRNTRFGLFP